MDEVPARTPSGTNSNLREMFEFSLPLNVYCGYSEYLNDTTDVAMTAKKSEHDGAKETPGPITGADLARMKEKLELSQADLRWVLAGGNRTVLAHRPQSQDDILPPPAAILVRILSAHPELSPITDAPTVDAIRARLGANSGLGKARDDGLPAWKQMALLTGNRAGSDWKAKNTRPSARVGRLLMILEKALDQYGVEEGLRIFMESVDAEARARGVDGWGGIVTKGGWPSLPGETWGRAGKPDSPDSGD